MKRFLGTPLIDYLPGLALLLIAVAYLATAYTYLPEARAFPVSVAWGTIVLVILDIVSRTHTAIGENLTRWFNPAAAKHAEGAVKPSTGKQVAAVLWALGFVVLIVVAGFLIAVPVYVFASMRLRGKRPLWLCFVISAGVTLFIWALFSQLLQIELYPGMIFSDV